MQDQLLSNAPSSLPNESGPSSSGYKVPNEINASSSGWCVSNAVGTSQLALQPDLNWQYCVLMAPISLTLGSQ